MWLRASPRVEIRTQNDNCRSGVNADINPKRGETEEFTSFQLMFIRRGVS